MSEFGNISNVLKLVDNYRYCSDTVHLMTASKKQAFLPSCSIICQDELLTKLQPGYVNSPTNIHLFRRGDEQCLPEFEHYIIRLGTCQYL